MLLLALDTATPATTVAVVRDGEVMAERCHVDPRLHGEVLGPLVAEAVAAARVRLPDLDAVAVGVGPGAYTGLRVGVVTAQALGQALGIPVHGVVTLDALAFGAGVDRPFAVVTDARRKELFWARYDDPSTRSDGPGVGRPDDLVAALDGLPVVGAGATPFADLFADVREPSLPSSGALGRLAAGRLAAGSGLEPPLPRYLRRPDASVPAAPKPVSRP